MCIMCPAARPTVEEWGGTVSMQERDNAKRPYEPPLLIVEGDVTDVTAGGLGAVTDDIMLAGSQ